MRTVLSRIDKLEKKFGTMDGRPQILVVLSRAGWGFGLDEDRCLQILGESGFLPTGPVGLVNLLEVPDLNADELEQYLREHGAELTPSSARPPLGGQPG